MLFSATSLLSELNAFLASTNSIASVSSSSSRTQQPQCLPLYQSMFAVSQWLAECRCGVFLRRVLRQFSVVLLPWPTPIALIPLGLFFKGINLPARNSWSVWGSMFSAHRIFVKSAIDWASRFACFSWNFEHNMCCQISESMLVGPPDPFMFLADFKISSASIGSKMTGSGVSIADLSNRTSWFTEPGWGCFSSRPLTVFGLSRIRADWVVANSPYKYLCFWATICKKNYIPVFHMRSTAVWQQLLEKI